MTDNNCSFFTDRSANDDLLTKLENLTLTRCNKLTENLTLERDQLLKYLTLTLTRYNNVALQRDQLQSEVNQLNRDNGGERDLSL